MIDEIVIARALTIQGWMTEPELRWLAEQATYHQAIAEIGCWKGRSTVVLAAHTSGRVWAIDHWQGQLADPAAGPSVEIVARGTESIYEEFLANIAPWRARVWIQREPSIVAACRLDVPLDFVFLDGAHDYAAVIADLCAYRPKLVAGGLLAGHDYSEYGRGKGVVRAVDEQLGPVNHIGDIWWRVL